MTFTVPLTFYNTACIGPRGFQSSEQFSAIESTLLSSKPTTLKSWKSSGDGGESGVAVGCEDGTLYLFQSRLGGAPTDLPVLEKRKKKSQPFKRSRPSSPSPNMPLSPTFNMHQRASVSLGVSTEQVQAPRNYVDFEDEPERLKDILMGKLPRNRSSSDAASLVTISPASSIILETVPILRAKESLPKSLLSKPNSGATTPQSPSSPTSPKSRAFDITNLLALQCHIVPNNAGYGNAVRAIEILEDNALLVALQESGHLGIYSSKDGSCLTAAFAPEYSDKRVSRDLWVWNSLQIAVVDEILLLLVTAATDSNASSATPDTDENSTEKSQTIVFKLSFTANAIQLEKMATWELEGPAKGIGIFTDFDNSSTLFSINCEGNFLVRSVRIPPSSETSSANTPPEFDPLHHLSIPKSLKAMVGRSSENVSLNQAPQPTSRVTLHETMDIGNLISDSTLTGLSTRTVDGKLCGIVWAHREMTIFEYHAYALRILTQSPVTYLENVEWLDDETYALSYQDRIEVHRLQRVNADNDQLHHELAAHEILHYTPSLIRQIPTGGHDASTFSPSTELILTKFDEEGHRQLVSFKVIPNTIDTPENAASTIIWQSSIRLQDLDSTTFQTSSIPLELDRIVKGYSDGRIRECSLAQLASGKENTSSLIAHAAKESSPPVSGSIVGLHCTQNPRTKEKYIIGGADDGSILLWSMSTFQLCARWIVFSTPLVRVVEFQDNAGPLRGCVLCIARDGAVAVIAVDEFQFLYLIPGSQTSLTRISLGDSNLVLIYGDSVARLWDVQTKEFWRSMTVDKAEEMFAQGGWTALDMAGGVSIPRSMWALVSPLFNGNDAAATLEFSLDKFIVECISLTKTISTSRDEIRSILQVLERLRVLLSIVITPGLNSDVDSICTGKLKLRLSSVGVGLSSTSTTTLYVSHRPQDVWSVSGDVSATRMLAIVFILRAMSLFEELSEAANTVIAFYTSSLNSCVGPQYAPPSLEWLGQRWFGGASDLRQSIRVVFDATLLNVSDQDAMKLAEKWQQYVPSLQPLAERESELAALSLLICGSIATGKFSLLSVSALTEISKSLTLYLHDENSSYRVLAIELCSKGFHVWQHYVDTMEILRALFTLSTGVRKDTISVQNVSSQARLAVLNIATHNTTLFMSTLCLDVLNPPSLDHRRAVMQIIAFLIRKRRHILQPNLPRLMEAVVKSLDPNSNGNREAVLDTATEIIGFVVKHFPSIDFHMNTQRLAVGTNEGAVVMYDLKTAIRLYVIEGHKKQLTACSFSPDGRRLVTLSLSEQAVLVWKVGSSFSSFFNPGAPPRQGHGGSEPFKTLNFNIGSEAEMTMEETLDLIKFEWVADRSVKVKIRDSILTFST